MAKEKTKKETKKETKLSPFTILGHLNCFTTNQYNGKKMSNYQKLFSEDDCKEAGLSAFLLIQFLKNHNLLINVAGYLNEHHKMKFYDMYLFAFFTFKQYNIGDVQWIKSDKFSKPEDIEMIMLYYRVKYKVALDYLEYMDENSLKEIRKIIDYKSSKE